MCQITIPNFLTKAKDFGIVIRQKKGGNDQGEKLSEIKLNGYPNVWFLTSGRTWVIYGNTVYEVSSPGLQN